MITFTINKSDCFDETTKSITIIQGNTAEINAKLTDSETDEDIILDEDDVILWYVKSNSGKEIAKKVFTNEDMNDDGSLSLKLKPMDTINIKPSASAYEYGLSYMPNNGDDAYTYTMGKFIVKPSCGTVNDLTS
ncbi:MAG: hypothetical protein NC253_08450 [Ruminococcus sp.]|nr:hypothetical protein [Ruminococcus sp.]